MIKHYVGDVRGSRFRHRDDACQISVSVGDKDDELNVDTRLGGGPSKSTAMSSSGPIGGNNFVLCCFLWRRYFALAQERQDWT